MTGQRSLCVPNRTRSWPRFRGELATGCRTTPPLGPTHSPQFGKANTKMLLPVLGRSSGVKAKRRLVVSAVPVLTATYCRPLTAYVIGKPVTA